MFAFISRILVWLASKFGGWFTAFFTLFLQFFSRRYALYLAALALFITMQIGFIATIKALFVAISVSAPIELVIAWGWFAPTNVMACMSAILSAYSVRYIYDLNSRFLFKGFANLGGK